MRRADKNSLGKTTSTMKFVHALLLVAVACIAATSFVRADAEVCTFSSFLTCIVPDLQSLSVSGAAVFNTAFVFVPVV